MRPGILIAVIELVDYQELFVTEDGYCFNYGDAVEFNGKYVITGKTNSSVRFAEGTYDVIFRLFSVYVIEKIISI